MKERLNRIMVLCAVFALLFVMMFIDQVISGLLYHHEPYTIPVPVNKENLLMTGAFSIGFGITAYLINRKV
jgi:hypothetical protein